MHKDVEEILLSEEQIIKKTKELGKLISEVYKGKDLVLIGLLKGSVPFMAELMKNIDCDLVVDFMNVSSYVGTESHEIRILQDLSMSVSDKDILIVEDIIDTGKTLKVVKEMLESRNAASVKIVTLLDKPEGRQVAIEADYVGFTIPMKFVVGFGLDYDEVYRNLPYVGVLKKDVYM